MRVYLFVLVRFRQQNILPLTGEKKVKTVNTEEGKNYFICTLAEPLFGKIFKYLRQRLPTEKKKYREERSLRQLLGAHNFAWSIEQENVMSC